MHMADFLRHEQRDLTLLARVSVLHVEGKSQLEGLQHDMRALELDIKMHLIPDLDQRVIHVRRRSHMQAATPLLRLPPTRWQWALLRLFSAGGHTCKGFGTHAASRVSTGVVKLFSEKDCSLKILQEVTCFVAF